jgi:hypothetical protein
MIAVFIGTAAVVLVVIPEKDSPLGTAWWDAQLMRVALTH